MKKIIISCLIGIFTISCNSKELNSIPSPISPTEGTENKKDEKPEVQNTLFTSTDKTLEKTFQWAKKTALRYSHDGNDPVGYWYEAALPNRQAFCMRDVSHQTVGAQILGLSKHNANMLIRFAENISDSKDWCTYWEINRYNRPAPADYTNDKEFWYNLNANFDMIQACLKMYQWTGDRTYLDNPSLVRFYEKSVNEYIQRWMLSPDQIMDRPLYMNSSANFDSNNPFHVCRGLASYVENFPGLTVSADLLGALYAGHKAYAEICNLKGDKAAGKRHENTARQYRELLETKWWDESRQRYRNFWTADKEFHQGEGSSYILWFNATDNPERIRRTVQQLSSQQWNVETLSYFPATFYQLGYESHAYNYLNSLPRQDRADYPEVSFGVIEGIAGGVMGIRPSASEKQICTQSRLLKETDSAEIKNVPVFGGTINVRHEGKKSSQLKNNTGSTIHWRATFSGSHETIYKSGEELKATIVTDNMGNTTSYADIVVPNDETAEVHL